MSEQKSLEPILNLIKRRGFIFNSADLYGGANGLFDLGPLGVELNNNIKKAWWRRFIQMREDIVPIDAAILTPAPILKASGHEDGFADPLIECGNCHIRLRSDHYLEEDDEEMFVSRWADEAIKQRKAGEANARTQAEHAWVQFHDHNQLLCPNCQKSEFSEPRMFNMMFSTNLGAVEGEGSKVYLRPETAQGIFTNYKNIVDTYHKKLPFGIGQIGKAFRNEITTGNSLFRVREFEQAEIEYFVKPGEDEHMFDTWVEHMGNFIKEDLGLKEENLRKFEHPQAKLSHYSKRTIDFEYAYPFGGWGELCGIANRTDFDLKQHAEHSGRDLQYFDEESREKYVPYVIEPTIGLGRALLTVLIDSYKEYPQGRDGQGTEMESVLHLPKKLAPVQVAILPLMKKDGLDEKAREIHTSLKCSFMTQYDTSGAIGRRYRRQDEIGTPYCITIDHQTLEDQTVTVRDRDTMEQQRVAIADLVTGLTF
jgi:glycyl-tRNA synthetase